MILQKVDNDNSNFPRNVLKSQHIIIRRRRKRYFNSLGFRVVTHLHASRVRSSRSAKYDFNNILDTLFGLKTKALPYYLAHCSNE